MKQEDAALSENHTRVKDWVDVVVPPKTEGFRSS